MKKTLFLLLIIIGLIACNDKKDKEKAVNSAMISGKITAIDSIAIPQKLIAYRYNDSKADYDEIEINVKQDGSFTKTIELKKPMSVAVYGDFGVSLVASPGDSIFLNTDARFESISYSGTGGGTNKSLEEYRDNNPTEKLLESKDTLSPQDYIIALDSAMAVIKSHNADYLSKNDDAVLKTYIESEEEFLIPSKKLAYLLFTQQGAAAFKDEIFMESFKNLPEYKESYDINNNNPGMVANYMGYVWENDAIEASDESRETAFFAGLMSMENNDYLKKKILQSKVMNKLEDNDITFYETHRDKINQVFNGTPIITSVTTKYDEVKKLLDNPEIPKNAELLTFQSQDPTQFIDEIIANANGKVIYIDNWATWCGPCKSEFKNASPELHEKFKDDVEFVYLCHNSKEAGYVPSIAKYKIAGKHYFLSDAQSRPIFKQIDLEGFPTYTIINKKGEIVLSDYIHRPSYAKTTEILTGLINEEL